MELKQYHIILVNLDPTIGSEIKKTRPCVVLSPNELNNQLKTVIIAPMTTKSHPYPTRIKVKHDQQEGWIVMDQIRTIDRLRVIRILGDLSNKEITGCKEVIKELLVD
ncbi:MAG: type II toxin-antitoxin system PemK/MazF family toxin [Cyclobacteriaceae bacterium]|nr:type II toxin-antitoxin system PemK/MazF family toxin [Cyclobacteriaceae bacterium]MCH8515029.1 type II toxin-antitoxin system PemK/MazF family toxin [Cyclobacteriaceae bacterium]